MKNVLVVGGAGYVGGAVVDFLMQAGHTVRVYDALLYDDEYRKPVTFAYGDVRDREKLLPHLSWADAVIWLAAVVADGSCALYPDVARAVNHDAVTWFSSHFDGRIIFPSTCLVYALQDQLLHEGAPIDPRTVYTQTKFAAEQCLYTKNALILRLGTLFGISDLFARPRFDLVVNLLTARALSEGAMTVFGGQQFRPLLHVRDVARLMVSEVDCEHRGVFNLHWQNLRIHDIATRIQEYARNATIEVREAQATETGDYRLSGDAARGILGFAPRYTLDDGIREVAELLTSHRLKDIRNPRYSNEAFVRLHPLT